MRKILYTKVQLILLILVIFNHKNGISLTTADSTETYKISSASAFFPSTEKNGTASATYNPIPTTADSTETYKISSTSASFLSTDKNGIYLTTADSTETYKISSASASFPSTDKNGTVSATYNPIPTTTTSTILTLKSNSTKDKGSCHDGYYRDPNEYNKCRFDFDILSKKANIKIVTKKMDQDAIQNEISSKCFLSCPDNVNCSALTGSVKWIFSEYNTTTSLTYSVEKKEFYSFLGHNTWESALGKNIMCTIQLNDNTTTFEAVSIQYDLILKCEMEGLTNDEINKSNPSELDFKIAFNEKDSKTKRLKCYSTIPFACLDTSQSNCELRFSLGYNSKSESDKVIVKQCSKNSNGRYVCNPKERTLKPSETWNPSENELIWDIAVKLESKNRNFKNESFMLVLKNYTTGQISTLFEKIKLLNKITVEFKYSSRSLSNYAACYNDPHCETFDKKQFELQQAGEYLMYENVETQTRIHVRSTRCNPGISFWYPPPFCLNKIFIQYFYELIQIDISMNIIFYSDYSRNIINQSISFDSSDNVVNDLNSLVIKKVGFGFEIVTGYGLVLKLNGYVSNYNLYINRYDIIPAKGDAGKIDGLFSNWNNDNSDDLTKLKNGSLSNKLFDIYESYEASRNGIPSLETSFYRFNSTEIDYEHSFCSSLNIDFFSSSDQPSPCINGRSEDVFIYHNKKSKRSTDSVEDPIEKIKIISESNSLKMYLSMPRMPHAPRRFFRDTTSDEEKNKTCESLKFKVENSDLKSEIGINNIVDNCKLDTVLDPETDYTNGYLNDISVSVIELATNDKEKMNEKDGQLVIKINLTNLCPNDCSGHGNCTKNGKCECHVNYSGANCILSKLDKPEIIDTTQKDVWDLSKGPLTDIIIRTKKFVSNNPDAKFKFSVYYPNINTKINDGFITPTEIVFNTNFLNMSQISFEENFYFIKLSATNDKTTFSDPITITAADLTKYICTTSTCTEILSSDVTLQKTNSIIMLLIALAGFYFKNF